MLTETKKVKILAIDDNTDNIVVLKALLTGSFPNMQFFHSQTGTAGIELCRSEKPDVILLDIVMTRMDGYDFCENFKSDDSTRNIPVVMLTAAQTDKESRIRALECGADAFLSRPLDESELIAQVRAMLRIKESEDRKLNENERLKQLVEERTETLQKELREHELAEVSLKESNEFNKSLLKTIPFGMHIVDMKGNVLFRSENFKNIPGKEIEGLKCWETYCDDKQQCDNCPLHRGVEIGETKSYEAKGMLGGKVFEILYTGMMFGGKKAMLEIFQDITARKHSELALKLSEAKFRTLTTSSSTSIIIYQGDKFLYTNKAFEELTGFTNEELVQGNFWDVVHPDLKAIVRERGLARQRGEDVPPRYEIRLVTKNGKEVWVDFSAGKINWEEESVAIGSAFDITERKLAEVALKESEDRYRSFISQVSEGVFRIECDYPMDLNLPVEAQIDFFYEHMHIAECNEAYLKMYGIADQKEMIDKNPFDLHFIRNSVTNLESLQQFIRNGYHSENAITAELNITGQSMYVSNNTMGVIENNHLVRIWGTQVEVTDKIKSDQLQQVLFAISNAAMTSKDLKELVEIISTQLGQLLDSTNFYIAFYDEASGMLSTHFEKDEMDQIECWPAEKSITGYVIRHRKSLLAKEDDMANLCKSGEVELIGTLSKVWLGVPLTVGQNVIGAIVVQSYDNPDAYTEKDKQMLEFVSHQVSLSIERKKAEQELREALVRAQESDRLKSAFLANVSHELRTPLNSILGFSDLLLDADFDGDQQLDFARMINASGNNLLVIINDIMDISKIEAGLVQLRKSVFSVHQLAGEILKEYSFKARNKGLELRLDPANPVKEIFIESDEHKLRQILINFVGNAIKFTENGFVEIGYCLKGNSVQFSVKDSGIGISEEFQQTVFERFRQVESAETRKYGGTGLGLAISKSLTELLGGEIGIESEKGKGSTFYFTIPK